MCPQEHIRCIRYMSSGIAAAEHSCGNPRSVHQEEKLILKRWFGWKSVIDLGDITTARGTEMLLPIWVRLWSALGTPMFNFKIAR